MKQKITIIYTNKAVEDYDDEISLDSCIVDALGKEGFNCIGVELRYTPDASDTCERYIFMERDIQEMDKEE